MDSNSTNTTTDYFSVVGCSALVVSPVLLCICFPTQKYIIKLQKELLAASLGTICAFSFLEIVPTIIKHAAKPEYTSKANKINLYLLSCTILLGMLFAALLGCLHEFMEHKHCDENVDSKQDGKKQSNCLSWIPSTCKVIWIGTALHNLADGMIIGLTPKRSVALALFIHELTHTLCNVTFYMTLGMTKCNAVILRIGSCIFVFFGSLGAQFTIVKNSHVHGHAFVLGIFLYMMLVDVLPILTGDQEANHCINQDEKHNKDEIVDNMKITHQTSETNASTTNIEIREQPHHRHHHHKHSTRKRKLWLLLIFAISFGIVAMSIVLADDPHDSCSLGCAHDQSNGQSNGPVHDHDHSHGRSHARSHATAG